MTVYLAQGGWVVVDERGRVVGRGETRDEALKRAGAVPRRRVAVRGEGWRRHEKRLRVPVKVIGFFVSSRVMKGTR